MSTFDDMMRIADEMKIDGQVCRKVSVIRWRSSLVHFLCSAVQGSEGCVGPAHKSDYRRLANLPRALPTGQLLPAGYFTATHRTAYTPSGRYFFGE